MTETEMVALVKKNLGITGDEKNMIISDRITDVVNFCNLNEEEIPKQLEPFIRSKAKSVIDYETSCSLGTPFDVKSITVGDTSTSFAVDDKHNRETIYGLSDSDKSKLRAFRRLRQ